MRRNQSASDFRASGGRGAPAKSSEDIYSRSQLEASAVNKESFFAKRMAENKSKPEGLPPLLCLRLDVELNYVISVMSEGFGRLSLVAASAANVVQTGTMEFTSKVKEGGLDHTVSETVIVVASKTTEIGQRTWGIMKGVMATASQKVEEFTKEEASTWNQQNTNEGNGYYQNKGVNYYVTVLLVLTNNSSSTRLILCGVNPITIIFVSAHSETNSTCSNHVFMFKKF
ncbi:hypothetical protein Bca52824_088619 [Brassica carinata]|uniref:Uncharacterized protein n=2 Tax=Brassica TaxID=3705 RepID=A0A8X7TR03_BRACI|nr:hypothetical protein Bca52824_088619 [Brassica carinata]